MLIALQRLLTTFKQQDNGAKILIQEVHDPQRYGVPELEGEQDRLH